MDIHHPAFLQYRAKRLISALMRTMPQKAKITSSANCAAREEKVMTTSFYPRAHTLPTDITVCPCRQVRYTAA